MSYSLNILWIKCRAFLRHLKTDVRKKWLEISVSLLIIIGLAMGGYTLFVKGAYFLLEQGELGQLLLDRIFYISWSIIFYLLILSNIITAMSTLYRSREISFLMAVPITFTSIFRMKFVENLLYSSWAVLILGIPLTFAYGAVKSISFLNMFLLILVGLAPFLIISTAIGISLLMWVIRLTRWFKMRSVLLFLGMIFIAVLWIYFKFNQQETLLTGDSASFRFLNRYLANLSRTPFPLIPSYWLSELFNSLSHYHWKDFIFYSGLFISTGLVGIEVSSFVAKRHYHITFQLMEGISQRKQMLPVDKSNHIKLVRFEIFKKLSWLTPPVRGLIVKDILQFIRTPQQWVQFLLLSFFIGVYLINLSRADVVLSYLSPFWQQAIYVLNFGFSGFFLAALTSRFVYPLISLEGKSLWILMVSPMNLSKLFKEKFWLSFVIFFTITEVVAYMSNYYLSQSVSFTLISTAFLILMSLSLISIALGLGAVYPQFHERNPMRISSSAGGIITIMVSLFYVAIMAGSLVGIVTLMDRGVKWGSLMPAILAILIFNVITTVLPLWLGYKSLLRTEL
ncbi:MAG: hypothetical protein IIB44_08200 [Candidatus Marinimicrobia bacterium]|nr:hypothetical protein [Candidatus Neomarinimicrobiota bacterium]